MAASPEAEEAVAGVLQGVFEEPAVIHTDVETGKVTVSVFARRRTDVSAARRTALREGLRELKACGLDVGPGRVSVKPIRREDWAESWKRHFKPLEIGSALLIKPSWSRRRPRKGQAVVVLDPGLSFGTGQHPTTRFCLEQLVACRRLGQAQSFLDIGTGSGILAIAAAKLGYAPVEAFDFDAEAVRAARRNALRNGVLRKIRLRSQDLSRLPQRGRRYDVICANLTSDLLLGEQDRILNRLKPGGMLVLAGILKSQFPAILKAYEAGGLKLVAHRAGKEWESGAFGGRCG